MPVAITCNAYGDYTLKQKVEVSGFVWVGKSLVPRLMFYAFFFMGAFGAEIAIMVSSFFALGLAVDASFLFLTGITAVAMVLFLSEGIRLNRKTRPKSGTETGSVS